MKSLVKYLVAGVGLSMGAVGSAMAAACGGAFDPCAVPEPSSLLLVAAAVGGLVVASRRSKK